MPGDSGVLVVTRVRSTTTSAHETAGALGIRHSPRPPLGGRFLARLGCSAPRGRERAFRRHCAPRSQPSSPANGSAEWPPDDRLRRAIQYSEAPVLESRSCSVLDTPHARGTTVLGGAGVTLFPGCRGACHWAARRLPSGVHSRDPLAPTRSLAMTNYGRRRSAIGSIRSVHLTIFWHCGARHFSFRTAWERLPGNEPSMVLAEDARPKGSGNADSQPNVRS
jgi:hypothetical protein